MTSLVTGATGFIGRSLVTRLAGQGDVVRALYRDPLKRNQYLVQGECAIRGDACDPTVMRGAVAGVDVVYHCAAAHSTRPANEIKRTNVPSVRCVLDAVRHTGGGARVVLMSSLNVLGNSSFAGATEDMPRRRTHDLHVDLKIEAEELAERAIDDGLNVVLLRPGLVYGPGDPHLPRLARAVYRGKFVFIGSRDNVVPMIHVSDMVEAMVLSAQASPETSRIFNLTDGSATTMGELVTRLADALECPVPIRVLPAVIPRLTVSVFGLVGRNGPISRSALRFLGASRHVHIGRARSELGFTPRILVEEGITAMEHWLRQVVATESAA